MDVRNCRTCGNYLIILVVPQYVQPVQMLLIKNLKWLRNIYMIIPGRYKRSI